MGLVDIVKKGYRCPRCNHEWEPKGKYRKIRPPVCPSCHSAWWDKPKRAERK
jgi:transposase-like protein